MGDPKQLKPIERVEVVRVPREYATVAGDMTFADLRADARFHHEPAKARYPGVLMNLETGAAADLYEQGYAYFRAPNQSDHFDGPKLYYQGWTE